VLIVRFSGRIAHPPQSWTCHLPTLLAVRNVSRQLTPGSLMPQSPHFGAVPAFLMCKRRRDPPGVFTVRTLLDVVLYLQVSISTLLHVLRVKIEMGVYWMRESSTAASHSRLVHLHILTGCDVCRRLCGMPSCRLLGRWWLKSLSLKFLRMDF
jgi:hypothetical protein